MFIVLSSVLSPLINSTKGIIWGGFQKCVPKNLVLFFNFLDISLTLRPDVLVAKIAFSLAISSTSFQKSCLILNLIEVFEEL